MIQHFIGNFEEIQIEFKGNAILVAYCFTTNGHTVVKYLMMTVTLKTVEPAFITTKFNESF